MADPHWSSYVGMVTGVIGALTGVIGYRKASHIKSLDLRLELKKQIDNAIADVNLLEELINKANKSRLEVLGKTRSIGGGKHKVWEDGVKNDRKQLAILLNDAPDAEENIKRYSQGKLEARLVEIHKYQIKVNALKEKYIAELKKDDEEEKQIREDRRRMMP